MGRSPVGLDPHWPPRDGDPTDVVTIVVTGGPDAKGRHAFWIKWHAGERNDRLGNPHGWRAQHFVANLRLQQAYWGLTGMRVETVEHREP